MDVNDRTDPFPWSRRWGFSSLVQECFKELLQTATRLWTVEGECWQPSACYCESAKESTGLVSTVHFPPSNTQGRLCRLGYLQSTEELQLFFVSLLQTFILLLDHPSHAILKCCRFVDVMIMMCVMGHNLNFFQVGLILDFPLEWLGLGDKWNWESTQVWKKKKIHSDAMLTCNMHAVLTGHLIGF